MAAALNGKWEIYSSENFENFMKAIGVTPENIEKATKALDANSKLTHEISGSGNSWSIKTTTIMGEKEIKFNLGEEFSTATLDGRPVKVTFTLEGDKLVEVQKGDGFESRNERSVSGGELVAIMSGNGVSCTRKYKKI
ncbi:hypothetical protein LOTGIDRAFT_175527 [Lottia gigantea]|uniref:Cytosolic fatty-acid binding proteins domain-containing protein n=1 Tax=Lottia gigantea TaxID=225164 RepID=V4AFZ0_LOTGI|nr:hypothetical protein LOTGIDRAFT_175527 [Lottia gigantea]ESO94070.1 hypothetical protein LOTGIDRAFT_175527 [Lottia gigantea]